MSKYAIAGKELIKGNFGNAFAAIRNKSADGVVSELIEPARWRQGNFFFGVFGADKAFVWGNYNSSLIAYQQCPIVSTVINRKAQCFINGVPKVLNADGKESQTPLAKGVRKLIAKPNPMQTGRQFRAQSKVYQQIYGYVPILIMCPVGFENDPGTWRLWNIPPWMLQVQDNQEFFFVNNAKPFLSLRMTYMGHSIELDQRNVFFLKENQISTGMFMGNANMENVSLFLPDSRLFACQDNISNIVDAMRSRGALIRERGPMWVMTNDSGDSGDAGLFPIDPDAKNALYEDFRRFGIGRNQRRAIITDAKLKLQTAGFDVAQLKLLEGEVQDAKAVCDQLNYQPELLGLIDSKYDNQDVAERALYTNSIIPDQVSDDEQWSDMLGLTDAGLKITTDFSDLPALQENITESGRGRYYMNQGLLIEWNNDQLTWNEWRIALGKDPVAGRDMYRSEMIKEGLIEPTTTPASQTGGLQGDSSNNDNNNDNGKRRKETGG